MTQQQIQKEISHYSSTGKLTSHPYLTCTVSGQKVMAFGPMLKKKIERHGGLEKLLQTFVCRKAQSSLKPPKTVKLKKKKKIKLLEKTEDQVYIIPPFRNEPPTILNLFEHPIHTSGACLRPDIFLNSGRVCDECSLSSFCLSPCKKFSNKKTKYTYA
jgi:hypothetical protein